MSTHYNYLEPLYKGIKRPLWSVMIPTYNCANYLRETLKSVLSQDVGEEFMQIEVIDDASDDDPEAVVKELGNGRVVFFQQSCNVGHVSNFETALRRSRGMYIHLLHGDDRVLWGFYREMTKLFNEFPEIGAGFCRHYFMDADGHQNYISPLEIRQYGVLPNAFNDLCKSCFIQTPSMVVKRSTYETIGMFDHRLKYTEDWEMWVRIAKSFPIGYVTTTLAEYRYYYGSNTVRNIIGGTSMEDMKLTHSIIQQHSMKNTTLPKYHKLHLIELAKREIKILFELQKTVEAHSYFYRIMKTSMPLIQRMKLLKLFLQKSCLKDTR